MAMTKLLKFSAFHENGEPGTDIIRPMEFKTKLASVRMLPEMEDFWRSYEPEPDKYLYLLNNIMGSAEYYGSNLNGDAFSEGMLRKYHKTFMQGHSYWMHDNDDSKKAFGKIIFSSYSDNMHRVENLTRLDRSDGRTQKIEMKMKSGLFPEISMGVTVPHDICAICENIAKTKADYCDHVRLHMRKLWPIGASDGRRVFVWNPHGTFFDNSYVDVPADPQSGVLGKVASVNNSIPYEIVTLSVDAGEQMKTAESECENEKNSEMEKPLDPTEQGKYVPKVEYNEEARRVAADLDDGDESIEKEALDLLSHYNPDTVVHTAAVMGIAIRPEEYGYLHAKRANIENVGSAILRHGAKKIKIAQPEERAWSIDFDRDVARVLQPFIEKRSFFPSAYEQRTIKTAKRTRQVDLPGDWASKYAKCVSDVVSYIGSDPAIFYKTAWVQAFVKTAAPYASPEDDALRREASLVVEMLSGAYGVDSQ